MHSTSSDNNIPLLTEVISAPVATPAPPLMEQFAPAPGYATAPGHIAPTPEQLQQISQDVRESVLQQLLGHVDTVLHQHLQDHLAVVLDNMADILKTRVRASLEQALEESVTQALAEEMAKFENSKY